MRRASSTINMPVLSQPRHYLAIARVDPHRNAPDRIAPPAAPGLRGFGRGVPITTQFAPTEITFDISMLRIPP
jgi:hypothetical protein